MNTSIKSSDGLHQADLMQLFNKEILALRIFPVASRELCKEWENKLCASQQMSRYSNATDVPVNRIGMTLFETENNPEKIQQYLENGQVTKAIIRNVFGNINPLDVLINTLCGAWKHGCDIQTMGNHRMNPGIIRSFDAADNGGLPPHIDSLLKDVPNHNAFQDMQCQLAANLYFSIPVEGGQLEIWDYEPSQFQLSNLFTGNHDFINPAKIPVKAKRIQPRVGEVILFRSSCVHSVRGNKVGNRAAASCFIGYYTQDVPLTIWS